MGISAVSFFFIFLSLSLFHLSLQFHFVSKPHIQTAKFRRGLLHMKLDWQPFKTNVENKMEASIQALTNVYLTLRLNGGSIATVVEKLLIPINTPKPTVVALSSISTVRVTSPSSIEIEPYDSHNFQVIENSVRDAGLGLTISSSSSRALIINIPPLTEERRKELVKKAKSLCEEYKVSLRNIRRDAIEKVKNEFKANQIDKDNSKYYQDEIQKVTDKFTTKIDSMFFQKEKTLMSLG